MRSITLALALAYGATAAAPPQQQVTPPRVVRLGLLTDGPAVRSGHHVEATLDEIRTLLAGEFEVEVVRAEADWTSAGVESRLDALLADPTIDVVLAGGIVASSAAIRRRDPRHPVIAPLVIDGGLQGAPFDRGTSGVHNLAYVTFTPWLEREIEVLRQLAPLQHLVFLRLPLPPEAASVLERKVAALAASQDVEASVLEVPADPEQALALLPPDTTAVFVMPLLHMSEAQIARLAAGLVERRLPSFSAYPGEVELGILASMAEPETFDRLGRRVAILLQRILLGEDAGTLPVLFERVGRLSLNVETARALAVYPSFAMEADARLVGSRSGAVARPLSLSEAVHEAVASNRDLAALEHSVESARQDVRAARANRLPQLDVSTTGVVIDADRGNFLQAQRSLEAGLGLRQLVYSDRVWSDVEIRQRLLEGSLASLATLRLDVARDAATSYLQVLQAQTRERITRRNLELTRENLERARTRVQVGVASRSEVLRWEAELAGNQRDVIQASAARNVAEIELNRIRDRPLEEAFATVEVGLEDPELATSDERILRYLRNRHVFRIFRGFNAGEALANSPELRELDAGVAAAERSLLSAKRSFFVPDVGLEARIDKRLYEGGTGADAPRAFDDWDWQIGLQASLPLFAGGARSAARARAEADLLDLRERRRAVVLRIDQRVRASMHRAGASLAAIDLARRASTAASESLELVSDAYARGVVSIIELLDAQNAAFVAELSAANARYQFMVDLMEVERAVGRFDFFATADDREGYVRRLEEYVGRNDPQALEEAR